MVQEAVLSVTAWIATLRGAMVTAARSERAQGLIEYAILIGAIALVAGTFFVVGGGGDVFGFGELRTEISDCIRGNNCG